MAIRIQFYSFFYLFIWCRHNKVLVQKTCHVNEEDGIREANQQKNVGYFRLVIMRMQSEAENNEKGTDSSFKLNRSARFI